jgi:dolichyl-phosphate beta-glucosyltransferase
MQAQPHLSIVVPAYNEAPRIRGSLDRLIPFFASPHACPGPAEVLIVDDGSADETARIVTAFIAGLPAGAPAFRLLRNRRNRGKGYTIKHGVLSAAGTFLLVSDTDFSTPIEELPRLLGMIERNECDIAIGSRGLPGSRVEIRQPAWRETLGRTFNRIVRAISGLPFMDTQCGFKVMRREAVLPLFRAARVERFAYDVEILYLARKAGLRIIEEPVIWRNAPGSKVNPITDAFDMLVDVLRIVLRDRRGGYGAIGAGDPASGGAG